MTIKGLYKNITYMIPFNFPPFTGKKQASVLLSLLLAFTSLLGQQVKTPFINFTYNEVSASSTKSLYVRDEEAQVCTDGGKRTIKKATLEGTIDLGEDYASQSGVNFSQTLHLDIKGYAAFSGTSEAPLYTAGGNWSIDGSSPEVRFNIDFTDSYTNVNRFDVQVSLVSSSGAITIVQNNLRVKVNYTEEFYYQPSTSALLNLNPVVFNGNTATFSWNPECASTPAPNYEIEILRLYNTNPYFAYWGEFFIETTIDWTKALKIETGSSDTEITLTLTEGTGYYIWRVRPIGSHYEGGIANDGNWGLWSSTDVHTDGGAIHTIFGPVDLFGTN